MHNLRVTEAGDEMAPGKVKAVWMDITVIRANGQREERGCVSYWHRSRFRRGMHMAKKAALWPLHLWDKFADRYIPALSFGLATLQVNSGRGIVTARLRGTGTEPLNIGWGTGAGTTVAADTTLFTEVLVNMTAGGTDHTVGASSQVTTTTTNDTYRVIGTRTATAVGTITNAGLFDAASGGTLFMKGDFAGIALSANDAISFTMNVQYS
mgnify:CR=1 FL=1